MAVSSNLRAIVDHDGAVILDICNDRFFSLNLIGSMIWSRLNRNESLEEIKAAIVNETGMDPSVVFTDVEAFVEELKHKKLFPLSVK